MKVVLLLDSCLTSCEKVQDDFNEAFIVALRLLSFLHNRDGDHNNEGPSPSPKSKSKRHSSTTKSPKHDNSASKKTSFKWGFKFFSSAGSVIRAKLSRKTSFTIWNQESFHNFQKNAETVFKNENERDKTKNKRSSFTHPSERLTTALTEVLHDFEWKDKSDLLKSPARSLRKRTSQNKTNKDKKSIVFIFSRAPSSRQCLRRFSNKVVIDSDVFIDSFMSPALLEEYIDNSRINVYWIDFNNLLDDSIDLDTRHESLAIVSESLKKLGGNLLHKHDILKYFPSNTRVPSFTELHPPISTLPPETSLLQGFTLSSDEAPSFPIQKFDCSIYVPGSCKLEMTGAQLIPYASSNLVNESSGETSETLETANRREALGDVGSLCLRDVDIELQGCISSIVAAEIIFNLQMQQSSVLTCDNGSKISSLLKMLIKSQNLGILKISPKQEGVRYQMAVLTALTSTYGHIFLISWNEQLTLEKAFMFDRMTSTKDLNPARPFRSHVLNSWHKPGSMRQLGHLVGDLKKRPNFQSPSSTVTDVLAKVKTLYLKAKQRQQQQQNPAPVTSTPSSGKDTSLLAKVGGSAESETGSTSSQAQKRGLSRRSSSSLSRGRLLVERARSASILMAGEEEGSNQSMSRVTSPAGRRTSGSAGFENLNIQSEDELLDYLNKQYSQVLGAGVAMEASIQAMLTVTCYFMSTKEMATNPQKSAISLIRKHLAQDPVKLKEKYGKAEDVDKKSQAVEYKLQVMMHLEMASFVPDNEEFQGEKLLNSLASMLRVLSFIEGPTCVREFMSNATDSYCGTLPRVLMDVYDELDMPYPPILAKLTSPSAPSTVWGPNMSVGSVDSYHSGPYSSQPPSSGQRLSQGTRRTSLKQHPSFTDFRQKKQILVEKPKSKPATKTEGKKSAKDKNKSKGRSTKTKSGVDYGRAKRNLFSDKSKVKKAKHRLQLTPKGKAGKPKLLVPGTPAHKQTSERILSRQKRLRDHLNIKPDVKVVEESPVKDDEPRSTVGNKPARFLLRESFYSSSSQSQSRIVAKSMEMEEKGGIPAASPHRFLHSSRSHGSLISAVRGESPILSPRSRMIKSFMASPSSEAKSDGKKIPNSTSTTSTTPTSHLPRRSPRKSVKKLLFHSTSTATTTSSNLDSTNQQGRNLKQNSLLDAKLVFDGENASDALSTMSPVKNLRMFDTFELKTPEKRNASPRFDGWGARSCPPIQVTPTKAHPRKQVKTPELSFKNVFNTPGALDKSPEPKFIRHSPGKGLQSVHVSPFKTDHSHDFYQDSRKMPGKTKAGLRKSASDSGRFDRINKDFVNLQKRISPQKAMRKASGLTKRMSSNSLRISDINRNSSQCGNTSNATNRMEGIDVDDGEIVLSTPKKVKYNPNVSSFHTTPSKVTFSDSFLISPPTGSGRPVALTPSKSILKGSPSLKKQSFVRRIELADCELKKLPDASFLSPTSKKTSSFYSPNKQASNSVSQDTKPHHGLSSKSPLKQSQHKTMSDVKRFDEDSSSSSCEASHLSTSQAPSSTVVTAHTPSPSNKCKTPDSINKWVRKKRNSGSRTVSSSSSSSISPSSSNEFKNASEQGVDASKTFLNAENVKQNDFSIFDGRNLKRNLFSGETASTSVASSPPCKKQKCNLDHDNKAVPSNNVKENEVVDKMTKGKGKCKNMKLFSHTSGGFSHSTEGLIQSQDESSISVERNMTAEGISAIPMVPTSSSTSQNAPYSCFSPCRSPSKRHRVLQQQSSSFMGEGSQGFLVESENHNTSDIPSTSESKLENNTDSDSTSGAKLSVDVAQSPSNSKSTPVKKQQYSPALSTSGLLHLIRSPLLDEMKTNSAEKRKTRSSKSRKHLDLPM